MESEELRLVNAFYGFCIQSGNWPAPLAELGYRPCGVEREIRVVLDGNDRTVVPDFICASAIGQHALCIETKSRTVPQDQANRYMAMRASSLLSTGNLPPDIDPRLLTHDVVYAAHRMNANIVATRLIEFDIPFPVVAGDEERFDIAYGVINQSEVQAVFAATIDVSRSAWPLHYVPFNSGSAIGEMAPFVAGALAQFIIKGQDFTGDDISTTATPHWLQCGSRERQAIRDKIVSLVNAAMADELQGYLERPGRPRSWQISYQPSGFQALSRLKRRMVEFVDRTVTGRPPTPFVIQMPLFPTEPAEEVLDEDSLADEDEDEL